jgi:hypothetical protein
VAKKSKSETENQADSAKQESVVRRAGPTVGSKSMAVRAAKKLKPRKAPPKKKPASSSKPVHDEKVLSETTPEPSDDQIRLRAYFIAERRIQLSLEGDSARDWLEAKRQLLEEAGRADL